MLKHLFFGGPGGGSPLADLGLLIGRLYVGVVMSLVHGLAKLQDPAGIMKGTEAMGFPAPKLFGGMAIFAEFAGGLLLAIGLATRSAAFLLASTMTVAGFIAHRSDPFQVKELAFTYLAVAVMYMLTGAGRFSVDSLIVRPRDGATLP